MRSKRPEPITAVTRFNSFRDLAAMSPLLYSALSIAHQNTPQRSGWSLLPLTNRSLFAQSLRPQILCGLLIALATVGLTSCHSPNFLPYKFPTFTSPNLPLPPTLLPTPSLQDPTPN